MLTIFGRKTRYCDGVSRRGFLTIGGLGLGAAALNLTDIFRAEVRAGTTSNQHKAVINIFLGGGPPHQDMWDIKTEAPPEIRGEFKPINTSVTGIQIGETFPRIAKMADKCVFIRSVVGATGGHDAVQCMSGWTMRDMQAMGGRPSLGAVAARVQGPVDPSVPPFIGLAGKAGHMPWADSGTPGFLGTAYAPFKPDGPGMANMTLKGTSLDQLHDRKRLLQGFDDLRRDIDASGQMQGMDAISERALTVLTSSKLMDALDVSKEPAKIRERYGDGKPYKFQYDGAPTCNDQLLMARRLIEAGARCVTLSYGRWDSHGKNFDLIRDHGTKLDQCFTALIEDLEARGMLNDVSVVVWGEFGRTPRINKDAGRDHWPQVSCALLAGGGMKTGQVIGSTNRLGEHAKDRPVTFQEIIATLYHNMGINPETTTINDPSGRPQHVVDQPAMRELI
jgi:hypothetical protein